REGLSYLLKPSERRQHVPGDHTGQARYQPSSVSPVMQRVRDCAYAALRGYQPRFYPGKINFVRAQVVTDFPYDPAAVWGSLVNEIVVETVPGDHLEIMTTHYARLAAVLSQFVREALR